MSLDFPPVDEQMALISRGAVDLVDEDQLRRKLERSRATHTPLTVKTGFDASAPDLHLGHSVLLRKMKHFQDLGHRVIFLIGDFTAMIGDPSGKKATRPQLTAEEVKVNSETYAQQVFHILDRKRTEIGYNSQWLDALGSAGIIKLAGRYTLARMMERDDFRKRFRENQAISIHELLYPLLQGYDSIALDADVELGGSDQLVNLLVGRDLMKEEGLEPQIILTVPLLVGLDGVEKMSKSLGNAIGLDEEASEIFGKTMSIPDSLMWDWFLLLTDEPEEDIAERKRQVASGELHPRTVKQELARRLTARYRSDEAADRALAEFDTVFARGGLPDDLPSATMDGEIALGRALSQLELAASNREAQRLIQQGAVSIDGQKQTDAFAILAPRSEPYLLRVGKRRFLNLTVR
jgi:tyrosyl-tRNA synthetase